MDLDVKFDSHLDDLQNDLEKLNSINKVRLVDLLNDDFVKSNTNLNSLDELLDLLKITNEDDYSNTDEKTFDSVIQEVSDYTSWDEFLTSAVQDFAISKLKL